MKALGRIAAAAGLVLATQLAVSAEGPAAARNGTPVPDMAPDAWQGQGQARSAEARGNQGRGNADRAETRSDQGRSGDEARGNSGQARGNSGQARGNSDQARGRADDGNRGRGHARAHARPHPTELRAHVDRLPEAARRFANSSQRGERIAGRALARASLRGSDASRFRVENDGSRVRVRNSRNEVLLDLSDQEARELGHWRMRRLGDHRPTEGSPAFCRSGEGHPVWGREWCLEKGFGLGSDSRSIWSRTGVDDVVFKREPQRQITLDRGGLIDVLGDIVLGRLAVHSLTLGHQEPLTGHWVRTADEPEAPWLLRVSAGDAAVAEFVDVDRDNEVDVLYVVQPRW